MSIVRADLKVFASALISDASSNGGRMSANELVSGVVGNVFPNASDAERTAGSNKFRKVFFKNSEDTTPQGLQLSNSYVYVENYTPGDDDVMLALGTQVDDQGTFTGGSPDYYGAGQLDDDISAGATELDVAVHDGSIIVFRDGDTIRISDRTDVDDTGGNEVFATISGTPVVNANVVTITVSAPIGPAFAAASTRVASVLDLGNLVGSYDNFVITSSAGTYDDEQIQLDNEGTIEDSWTITFVNGTSYNVSGAVTGSVGSGNTTTDFAPTNSAFGKPYFTLPSAGWGGVYQAGDTVEFDTHPAAGPVWLRRQIPAGIDSITGNLAIIVFEGESE